MNVKIRRVHMEWSMCVWIQLNLTTMIEYYWFIIHPQQYCWLTYIQNWHTRINFEKHIMCHTPWDNNNNYYYYPFDSIVYGEKFDIYMECCYIQILSQWGEIELNEWNSFENLPLLFPPLQKNTIIYKLFNSPFGCK